MLHLYYFGLGRRHGLRSSSPYLLKLQTRRPEFYTLRLQITFRHGFFTSMKRFYIYFLLLTTTDAFANLANFVHVRETVFWEQLYTDKYHTLYCAIHKNAGAKSTVTHIYPSAWMANAMNCPGEAECDFARYKDATSDLHNLWPVEEQIIEKRRHYAFAEKTDSEGIEADCNFVTYPRGVEPRDWAKGEIARSVLYIIWKYNLPDYGQVPLMVKWANTYPPNTEEKWRNEKIKKIQRNENPFITEPKRVNEIFDLEKQPQKFSIWKQ